MKIMANVDYFIIAIFITLGIKQRFSFPIHFKMDAQSCPEEGRTVFDTTVVYWIREKRIKHAILLIT